MSEYKDITPLKKQIKGFKQSVYSSNSDYMTGYLSAISATEGIICALPDEDVVPVVRCKDCKWYQMLSFPNKNHIQCVNLLGLCRACNPNDYCSHWERKSDNE